jgi:hypothetical protein
MFAVPENLNEPPEIEESILSEHRLDLHTDR